MTNLAVSFAAHRGHLWAIGYRMLGSAADAEDLVQQTYLRAMERPPESRDGIKPWLVRVTMNLARDELRRRKRRPYPGTWLPEPIVTPPSHEVRDAGATTEARYDLLESVSFAFLLALEALTPTARAVLLLRDAFDYSVRETAEALAMSEANVKTTLHRARKQMRAYDLSRERRPTDAQVEQLLQAFLAATATGDVAALETLLASDVRAVSDAGGKYHSARNALTGRSAVARFFVGIAKKRTTALDVTLTHVNGALAVALTFEDDDPKLAPRTVISLDASGDGSRVRAVYVAMAPDKIDSVFRALAQAR